MPTVEINEETVPLDEGATVVTAVARTTGRELTESGTPADGGRLGVAVALGGEVVPRSRWAATELSEGDELEIVTAVQGG
ncbi:sulfur carrier protein ThiS [Nesterenkonia alkaliphila]|uniref:Sulfur carrier protein ThiS n=1 Tax=Nesterenkonia alkaliphila TaxID=1463631 RepID=A0A7K1UMM8_9MICC|nr:sulfur carrier protein ThiS [Nesterenkonia alkaliphila]MVT27739.1 sulfur carrier protein ThiS [Nesterenkonia alkaliphila]GFZ87551.1 thiamine biosynthesis protein ThiS [Nesterenkonia alkaliphila]